MISTDMIKWILPLFSNPDKASLRTDAAEPKALLHRSVQKPALHHPQAKQKARLCKVVSAID